MKSEANYQPITLAHGEPYSISLCEPILSKDWSNFTHFHELHEINLFENAKGDLWVDGQPHPLNGNVLVFLPTFTFHNIILQEGKRCYKIHFSNLLLQKFNLANKNHAISRIKNLSPEELSHLIHLCSWRLKLSNEETTLKQEILRLLYVFISKNDIAPETKLPMKNPHSNRFLPILKSLNSFESPKLGIPEAASMCALSRTHFTRLFRKQFGISFYQFVLEKKINRTMHLLTETDASVIEIADKLGFSDSAHLAKVFKDKRKMTPAEFRRMTMRG